MRSQSACWGQRGLTARHVCPGETGDWQKLLHCDRNNIKLCHVHHVSDVTKATIITPQKLD
jgi:hypothetical protein